MIDSCREVQARHEGHLLAGIRALVMGEDSPQAEAAGRILAETIIMWREGWKADHKQE